MINWLGKKPSYPAGHCQFCGYNLFSLQGELCPECGKSRLAWVEATCDECGRVSVFAPGDAGKLHSCTYCGKTVDVPAAKRSSRRPADSIAKTRFSIAGFLLAIVLASLVPILVFSGILALCFFLVTGYRPPPILILFAIAAGGSVGIGVAWKYSHW